MGLADPVLPPLAVMLDRLADGYAQLAHLERELGADHDVVRRMRTLRDEATATALQTIRELRGLYAVMHDYAAPVERLTVRRGADVIPIALSPHLPGHMLPELLAGLARLPIAVRLGGQNRLTQAAGLVIQAATRA